jgi:glycosyltransferase involved in cell wall biosynthesis
MMADTISIIVLTHDRKRMLQDCLHSLLNQTYPADKIQIVVSDDGSRDGTAEVVERLQASHARIKYARQPHRGIAAARNNGIANASNAIIAIVADDYILDPTYASTIMRFFAERPDAGVVRFKMVPAGRDPGSRISHFYFDVSVRRRLTPNPPPPAHTWKERLARTWQKTPRFEETITTDHQLEAAGAAAFRRGILESAGRFDESLQRAEDTDMTMRLRAMGIAIYYNPFQEIRHQYSPFMEDTLSKCFLTGFNRYRLYQKHGSLPGLPSPVKTLISHEVQAVLGAFWRARQAESIPKLVFYLPFMLLFEASTGLGFLAGFISRFVASPRKRTSARI